MNAMAGRVLVGCAGWSLPRAVQPRFAEGGSHLARYASRFGVTEINSSFHRPHQRALYEKWAAAVPADFAFAAKLPKTITHERKLLDGEELLRAGALPVPLRIGLSRPTAMAIKRMHCTSSPKKKIRFITGCCSPNTSTTICHGRPCKK